MRRWSFACIFACAFALPVSAGGQTAQPASPAASQTGTPPSPIVSFHEKDQGIELANPEVGNDVRKAVDEILKSFGILSVDWKIEMSGGRTTQYARAWFHQGTGERKIFFNSEFLTKIFERPGKWAAYCVAAHEIGHHLRSHFQKSGYLRPREAELEADYDCGHMLGKLNVDYDEVSAVMTMLPAHQEYPALHERKEAIGRGWRDATGKSLADQDALSNPVFDRRRHALVLGQFTIQQNRDIYLSDIASTDGVPGIPGLSLFGCADRCRKDPACKAFSLDKWNGRCYVKGDAKSTVLDPRSVTGIKKSVSLPRPPSGKWKFVHSNNRSFADDPFDEKGATDRKDCEKFCDKSARCIAYTFLRVAQDRKVNCRLFAQSDGYYEDPAADSGFKVEPEPQDVATAPVNTANARR